MSLRLMMSEILYTGCPVCHEDMNNPILLPCLHSMCKDCLKNILHLPNGKVMQCPVCQERVDFNSETIFPFNFLIDRMLGKGDTPQTEPLCDCCSEGSRALCFCEECQQFLCEFCSTAHKRMSRTKSHKLLAVEKSLVKEKTSLRFCAAHDLEEPTFFCQTCQVSLCKECVLSSVKHRGHTLVNLKEEVDNFKKQLEKICKEAEKKAESITKASDEITNMLNNVEKKVKKTSKGIQECFDNLINHLQERRTSLLNDLEVIGKSKARILRSQSSAFSLLLRGYHISQEFTQQVFKLGSENEIVALKHLIKQRFLKFNQLHVTKKDLEPKEDDKIEFIIGNSSLQWELSVLGRIDKGTSPTQPSLCFAHGQSLHSSTAGQRCTFKITALNTKGQVQTHGGDRVDVIVKSSEHTNVEVGYKHEVKDNSNGTYSVAYTVQSPGVYSLDVRINQLSISKSPFTLRVYPTHWTASKHIISAQRSGGMKHPSSAYTAHDKIFITDSGNHRVIIKNIKGDEEHVLGCYGDAPGQFSTPHSLALSPLNQLVITDSQNHRLQIMTLQGKPRKCFGCFGTAPGEFNYPTGLAVNHQGNIFVADSGNNRIQVFTSEGVFVRQIGMTNGKDGIVGCPWGIAVGEDGSLVVSDYKRHVVQVFDREGKTLRQIGRRGSDQGLFNNPAGLCLDSVGRIIVADKSNHRVQIFSAHGEFLETFGYRGEDDGFMKFPGAVAIGENGYYYVVDTFNNRIQVFHIDLQDV